MKNGISMFCSEWSVCAWTVAFMQLINLEMSCSCVAVFLKFCCKDFAKVVESYICGYSKEHSYNVWLQAACNVMLINVKRRRNISAPM